MISVYDNTISATIIGWVNVDSSHPTYMDLFRSIISSTNNLKKYRENFSRLGDAFKHPLIPWNSYYKFGVISYLNM